MQHVRQIPFEVSKQHLLGLRTELSALRIVSDVAKQLQAKARRMVLPPKPAAWPKGVGECDAILLTDVAVFLVEVKRYGVQVRLLDDSRPLISVVRDRKEEQIRNPAMEVCSKSDSLQQLLRELPEWRLVNKLFDVARVGNSVPVVPVLCFGPSTKIDEIQVQHRDLIVCNTRNIRLKLGEAIHDRKAVLGASQIMGHLAASWRTIGKLSIQGKAGFLKAWPLRTVGQTMSFADLSGIKTTKTGRLAGVYADKVKVSTKDVEAVVFGAYVQRQLMEFECPTRIGFSWNSVG
jgi:hypothetical protein